MDPSRCRAWGERGAGAGGCPGCSSCSPSPGIAITPGGCSRCFLGREFGSSCSGRAPYGAALQAEGRCQRLRQPRVPHLGTAFYFFFLFFQLHLHQRLHWFAWGNPIPVTAVPPEGVQSPSLGTENVTGLFWPQVTWVKILSPGWASMCLWYLLAPGRSLLIPAGGRQRGTKAASSASSCLPEPPSFPPCCLQIRHPIGCWLQPRCGNHTGASRGVGMIPPRQGDAGLFVLTSPAYYNSNGI